MNIKPLDTVTYLSLLISTINYNRAGTQTSGRGEILLQLACTVLQLQLLFRQCTLYSSCDNPHGTILKATHLTE
jgi:hypothetical protein